MERRIPEELLIREAMMSDLTEIHRMQCALADVELPWDGNIDMTVKNAEKSKGGYVGYVNIEAKIKEMMESGGPENSSHLVLVADASACASVYGTSPDNTGVDASFGGAVGICYGQIKKDEEWSIHDSYGYIGCVFVDEAYRGGGDRGVWPRMLARLEEWFRSRGIQQARLECYKDNKRAVTAYSKASFRPVQIVMQKTL